MIINISSGFRLEPIKDLRTLDTVGYEVLTPLPSGICPEQYFEGLSSQEMVSLFSAQMDYCFDADAGKKYFVNLPASVLADPQRCTDLPTVLESRKICIELQDPQNLHQMNRKQRLALQHNIRHLREKGYQIWLDDVTTSLVNLTSSLDIVFDGIKIDKSEILSPDSRPEELVSLITQCKKHTPKVLVEGIETGSLLERCIEAGAKMGQGYMWKKEMLFV
jgi:EAL domain-containing protein (putative c-di-GMP-specific phosphodiesterase class I)